MARRLDRVDLYNALVKKHMREMFPNGAPQIGIREEVRELQARVLEDKEMIDFYREEEEERDGD